MISLIDQHYPDCLSPNGLPNYNPNAMWVYRDMVPRSRCPHLMTPEAIRRFEADKSFLGPKHFIIRSRETCEFHATDEECNIFEAHHIEAARDAMGITGTSTTPIGNDVRGAGDIGDDASADESVIAVRKGTEFLMVRDKWESQRALKRAGEWVSFLRDIGIPATQFCLDGGGIGAIIYQAMQETHGYWGVVNFGHNAAPHFNTGFADRYTELHWIFRELLELGVLKLPHCPKLLRDMRERLYVESGEKTKTQPKGGRDKNNHRAKYGHSPNFLDAVIYCLWDFDVTSVRAMKERSIKKQKIVQKIDNARLDALNAEVIATENRMLAGIPDQPSVEELFDGVDFANSEN